MYLTVAVVDFVVVVISASHTSVVIIVFNIKNKDIVQFEEIIKVENRS